MIGLEIPAQTMQTCLPYTGIFAVYTLRVISWEFFRVHTPALNNESTLVKILD